MASQYKQASTPWTQAREGRATFGKLPTLQGSSAYKKATHHHGYRALGFGVEPTMCGYQWQSQASLLLYFRGGVSGIWSWFVKGQQGVSL